MTSGKVGNPHKSIKCVILPSVNLPFRLPSRWTFYILGFFILLLSILTAVGERGALHLWRLRQEKTQLDVETHRLQKENESLRQRISKLRNDNYYLEKQAREDLNLVRPGEIIYRFSSSQAKKKTGNVSGDPAESRPSKAQKQHR
jgi:cell division protein FtsB